MTAYINFLLSFIILLLRIVKLFSNKKKPAMISTAEKKDGLGKEFKGQRKIYPFHGLTQASQEMRTSPLNTSCPHLSTVEYCLS